MTLTHPDRHVHQVHLTATSQALIQRGVILLEDALHTASLPQHQGSRVLVVRSLNLGMIHSHRSSATLALTLEARLRHLEASAVYATDPAAAQSPVVYFHDAVDPYLCLAQTLSRGACPTAWFWPLAIAGWQPQFSPGESLRHCVYGVLQTPAGVGGLLALIQCLHDSGGLELLLTALQESDGRALLHACHWSIPPSISPTFPFSIAMVAPWHSLWHHWVGGWGVNDGRSLWFAIVILALQNPARLLDPELPQHAAHLLQQTRYPEQAPPAPTLIREAVPPLPTPPPHPPKALDRIAPPDPTPAAPTAPVSPLDRALVEPVEPEPTPPPHHRRSAPQPPPPLAKSASPVLRPDSPPRPECPAPPPLAPESTAPVSAPPDDRLTAVPHLRQIPPVPSPTLATPNLTDPGSWNPLSCDQPQLTAYAGFYFLIPLLQRLGFTPFLATHPSLIELAFPQWLLRAIAHRLAIPETDPLWGTLAGVSPSGHPPEVLTFSAPLLWRQGIVNAGLTQRVCVDQRHLLFDASGRLPLAFWRHQPPASAQPWFDLPSVAIDRISLPPSDVELLGCAWAIALRRGCRRHAQMGLHALIHRPGRVAVTRTHLDVFFHPQQADIRIRRLGLDINPGWVAWLGRVVTFHYLYGEPNA